MKPLISFTACLCLALPAFGAEAEVLRGPLKEFTLLTGSKNQPAMAVLANGALFFAEGKNLESSAPEDCPAADLYRYDLIEKAETRIAELGCVLNLLSDGVTAYVVTKDTAGALSVARIVDNKNLQPPSPDSHARIKARVAFKRSAMKLPRGVELAHITYVLRDQEVNAVFKTDTHLFFDAVSFDKPSTQTVLPFSSNNVATSAIGFSGNQTAYSFTKGSEGWLRVVETKADGTSTVLGHQRPLPKSWIEVGPLDWGVRTPRFLVGLQDGFLVADRTPEAFTEATAVSWYSSVDQRFYRLDIPDQDVGGLSYARGGVIVSKPMAGSIVWYGKTIPFQNEVTK